VTCDCIFAIGAPVLGWFVLGLLTGHSYGKRGYVVEGEWACGRRRNLSSIVRQRFVARR